MLFCFLLGFVRFLILSGNLIDHGHLAGSSPISMSSPFHVQPLSQLNDSVAFPSSRGNSGRRLVRVDTDTPNRKMMKDNVERRKELEFELDDSGVDLSRFHNSFQ